ncbi:MAG: phosphatidate cytidylyltransferase [Gammaproteobacteria bacterium]|jgi:phosphatidate cytidylyltransferase|nr:phosphatidate cytidylyltransferase [Gammaproteobacteria bacterium]
MLLQRILTAVPLALAAIWLILYQPTTVLLYVLLLVAFISGYEWARLSGVRAIVWKLLFALLVSGVSWLIIEYLSQHLYLLLLLACAWWFAVVYFLKGAQPQAKAAQLSAVKLAIAFIVIPSTIIAMYVVHGMDRGAEWLLYSLMLVWIADSGAYFSGKIFGKRKLAPNISPGKTREGLWGALLMTAIYAVLAGFYFDLSDRQLLLLLGLSLLLTIFSVAGDLYISILKREAEVKDSGNILPGHGGILDRVDGVLAVMPVFVMMFDWLIIPVEGLH